MSTVVRPQTVVRVEPAAGSRLASGAQRLDSVDLLRGLVMVVHWGWKFNLDWHFRGGAVIWAIGCSMILLSTLVWLPTSAVAVFGLAVITFHNLFDDVAPGDLGRFGWIWQILHSGRDFEPW